MTYEQVAAQATALPADQLVRLWQHLTLRISTTANTEVSDLFPPRPTPITVDERIGDAHAEEHALEQLASTAQLVSQVADTVLHLTAAAHHDAVAARDRLELDNVHDLPAYAPRIAEFAGDSLGLALGISSGTADALARETHAAQELLPSLVTQCSAGNGRIRSVAAAAYELVHLGPDELPLVRPLLEKAGVHLVRPQTAREKTRRILRGLHLEKPQDEFEVRRECGIWFTPHLEFDGLTEMRVVLETADAARLRAVIEARARQLAEAAPDLRCQVRVAQSNTSPEGYGDFIGAHRADALLDLALSNARVVTTLHLKVPLRVPAPQGSRSTAISTPSTLGYASVRDLGVIPPATVAAISNLVGTQFTVDLTDGNFVTSAASTTTYRPTSAIARLVRERDEHCRFPFCTKPADVCDLDHVRSFAEGGTTSADNLQSLCRHHHRAKTHGGFAVTMTADGVCTWESPTGQRWVTTPEGTTAHVAPVNRQARPEAQAA